MFHLTRMTQSSHELSGLPVCFAAFLLAIGPWAPHVAAQQVYRVLRAENFRRQPAPSAAMLAAVVDGVQMNGDMTRDGWVRVTLEGWVWARSLQPTTREGHDVIVSVRGGENLRAAPNGRVVARLANGALLDELQREPGWVRVRRIGWMWGRSLQRITAARAGAAVGSVAPASGAGTDGGDSAGTLLDRALTAGRVPLRRVPDGQPTATLAEEAPVRILARSGEWVRVQTEGWVRESELRPAAAGVLVGVSGAEVRSRPSEFEGTLLKWTVQYIAMQDPDELRREIPAGQRYLLARGPLPEAGFIYITLTDAQIGDVERLPALAEIEIVGRVRAGRSQYVGNPVLELIEMAARRP